jgi:hypothetical protein
MERASDVDDDSEFWGRPSARQALELERQVRRERYAADWRRNLLGLLVAVVIAAGAFVLWHQ